MPLIIFLFNSNNIIITQKNSCSTSELKTTQLECYEAIAHLNNMYKCIEVIRRNDEAIALQYAAPAAEQQVSTQTVLQRTSQMLVKYRVEVVIVSAGVVVQL